MIRQLMIVSALLFASAAHAEVLTFEGSTTTGANRILDVDAANAHGPSLIDYAGYDWTGMAVAKPLVSVNRPRRITGFEPDDGDLVPVTTPVDAGFHRSVVSGDTVAFTQSFAGASSLFAGIRARPGASHFDFFSVYLTSGWRDDINVSITGLRDGSVFYTRNLVIGDGGPVLVDLDFLDIDEIRFVSSGGSFLYPNGGGIGGYVNPGNAFSTPVLVFDNIDIAAVTPVPEPEIHALLAAGLALTGWIARRRRRAV